MVDLELADCPGEHHGYSGWMQGQLKQNKKSFEIPKHDLGSNRVK